RSITFPPGDVKAVAAISIVGEKLVELDETLRVKLSQPVNATLERAEAVATIANDDDPTLTVEDQKADEGNSGVTPMTFKVKLSAATSKEVILRYHNFSNTARSGDDFQISKGEIKIPSGTTEASISVDVIGDTIVEPDETFTVHLTEPKNATIERG